MSSRFATRPAILAVALLAAPRVASAAEIRVTDCSAPPVLAVQAWTLLDVRPNDLVLACPLVPLPGTKRILVQARRITVEGPAGTIASSLKGVAVQLKAEADVVLRSTSLEASNANGSMRVTAVSGVNVHATVLSVGSADRPGRELRVGCTGAACPVGFTRSTVRANRVKVLAQGTVSGAQTAIVTRSPRDRVFLFSDKADVRFGQCGNQLRGGNEARFFIHASKQIDLSRSEVAAARTIDVQAGLGGSGSVLLRGTTLRNDFGKPGEIAVTAANGQGMIDVEGATLIDDDKPARINDRATLNGSTVMPRPPGMRVQGRPEVDS